MPRKIAAAPALLALSALALLVAACRPADAPADASASPAEDSARAVVEAARRAHGSAVLDRAVVSFTFRGAAYTLRRDGGRFDYARAYADTAGVAVVDRLTNDGLTRTRAGRPAPLDDRARASAETQVNSVAYFALLPYNLADPAVRLRPLPDATIRGERYRTVEATFAPEGGGRDFEDRFVYWFHPARHTLDYLAYHFHTGEGGTRFRVATNAREVGGARFADYENHADSALGARIEDYPARLGAPTLRRVSDVVLEGVRVEPIR